MKKVLVLMSVVVLWAGSLLAPAAAAQVAPAQVIARGAPIHGANGVMFDGKDRLHVASVGMRSIVAIDPETGAILDRIGPDRGVEGPDDLTFGPDGSLYWTALFTGEVGKLSPDGMKSTVAKLPPGVNAITFSDDGRLFVALDFLGDGLYELDPTGAQPPRLLIDKLGWLNAMDFGPDGLLYGPIFTQGRVVKIDVNAQPATVTAVAEGFAVPVAVKFNAQGQLYAVDAAKGQVERIDTATGAKEVIATISPGLDNLAFDSRGRLFVSSNDDGFIVEVRPDGTTRTVSPGGMIAPGGVAIVPRADGSEAVIVGDMFTLREFDGQTGAAGDAIHHPAHTVARDGDRLVLSSWFANAVQIRDPAQRAVVENYADFKVPLNAIRCSPVQNCHSSNAGLSRRVKPARKSP
jgi:sugar lactone lactonase YvrE